MARVDIRLRKVPVLEFHEIEGEGREIRTTTTALEDMKHKVLTFQY